MEVRCDYCGSMIPATVEKCPNCGAPNNNMRRSTDGTPKTIEELLAWYKAMNLPPEEVTRFFIGKNISEPRAFGIYEYSGEFIVYKNKDDGTRAIRYQGKDEAYAVNEIYLKLKAEILNQKSHNLSTSGSRKSTTKWYNRPLLWFIAAIMFIYGMGNCSHRNDGYYQSGSDLYYNYGNTWYYYNALDDDYYSTSEPWFSDSLDDYSVDDSYYDGSDYDFKDSTAWDDIQSSNSDYSYDSDYSWDSGSDWDSGGSDWGSDW